MGKYEGLDPKLRSEVLTRDRFRCRWCGATNQPVDLHHIVYRRGVSDDKASNLITLDRGCHEYVHGALRGGKSITKQEAQKILFMLIERPGTTGSALRRSLQKGSAL